MFESNAGELAPEQFREFSLPFLLRIAVEVKQKLLELEVPLVPMVCPFEFLS